MARHHKKRKSLNKDQIIRLTMSLLAENPRQAYNYRQLSKVLGIKDEDQRQLVVHVLRELAAADKLEEDSPGKYRLKSRAGHLIGKIDLTQYGYGFLLVEGQEEDVFIGRNQLHTALDGDTVKVRLFPVRKRGGRMEGEVVEVLERARETFVGIVEVSKEFAFLNPDSRKMPYDLFIPLNKLNGAKSGQKAVARITEWPSKVKNPFAEIIEVLGEPGTNEVEMHAILSEFDLPWRFTEELEQSAGQIPDTIDPAEIELRRDFRGIPTFTIDPHDAKDFDDALSLRKLPDGNLEIGVHIADVSHYVTTGSIIDEEAYERATSVYLVDRVVPMLPERLSNYICSLRPDEDKLCFSAVFIMDASAGVISEWIGRTIIRSQRRFAYEEAQQIIEGGEGDMKDEILTLNKLARILRENRFRNGAISFERVEVKFNLDEKGNPLGVYFKEMKESNQLIEEFMLLANRTVSEWVNRGGRYRQDPKQENPAGDSSKAKTFVYRVHDNPNQEKIASFANFIRKFGYSIDLGGGKKMSVSMNKLLDKVVGTREQNIIETLALRAMAKARYSTDNIGHYGLAFRHYTHFTSPIRRYPDLMVHRLLAHYLKGGDSKNKKKYEHRCVHSSDMEKRAMEAERASVKYKQAEYLLSKEGQEFDAIISGLTDFGMFAEIIENKCEGMIPLHSLSDDFYEFDEDNYLLSGRHSRKKYQLGDPVRISVKNVNLAKRQIDFKLVELAESKNTPKRPSRKSR